jgi:uncharacterized protein (TIGR03435 family)
MKYVSAAAALIAAATVLGQSPAPLAFEVASIKTAAPCCAPGQWRESKAENGRIDFRYVTLRYCLAFAYRLKEYQVSGPAWLNELRFDIVAKAPDRTRNEELPEMVRALLAERFKLEAHQEQREFNVFALLVGKGGPKLNESPPLEAGVAEGASFGMSSTPAGHGRIEVKRATMTALANTLPRMVGRPVVDLTGLTGRYDFDLEFSPEDARGMVPVTGGAGASPSAAEFGVSIFTSLQRVGLKLEAQRRPLEAIVVDRAERVPTEN